MSLGMPSSRINQQDKGCAQKAGIFDLFLKSDLKKMECSHSYLQIRPDFWGPTLPTYQHGVLW